MNKRIQQVKQFRFSQFVGFTLSPIIIEVENRHLDHVSYVSKIAIHKPSMIVGNKSNIVSC